MPFFVCTNSTTPILFFAPLDFPSPGTCHPAKLHATHTHALYTPTPSLSLYSTNTTNPIKELFSTTWLVVLFTTTDIEIAESFGVMGRRWRMVAIKKARARCGNKKIEKIVCGTPRCRFLCAQIPYSRPPNHISRST